MKNDRILATLLAGLVALTAGTAAAMPAPEADPSAAPQSVVVQVHGVVLDTSGQPVIGAGVLEVGKTSNGVLTAADGTFVLTVNRGASLEISCMPILRLRILGIEIRKYSRREKPARLFL